MSTRQVIQIPDDPTASFEPAMVENLPASIDDKALELSKVVSGLNASIHPVTLVSLEDAFRFANSYYSNLIEGNNTHPITIERAMRGEMPVKVPLVTARWRRWRMWKRRRPWKRCCRA